MTENISPELLTRLRAVTAKRARVVIEHILEHGQITSEELKDLYGYNHPPRAVRDVREEGIPIETFRITSSDGRKIAAYRFGDLGQIKHDRLGGRKAFSKRFKDELFEFQAGKCMICNSVYEIRYMQIDHRIPYEIAGNTEEDFSPNSYMLLCMSCNRAKSWSCENCENTLHLLDRDVCQQCYWYNPLSYRHVALSEERRVTINWQAKEVKDFEALQSKAQELGISIQDYIKQFLSDADTSDD